VARKPCRGYLALKFKTITKNQKVIEESDDELDDPEDPGNILATN
jgi:hypothetical protein